MEIKRFPEGHEQPTAHLACWVQTYPSQESMKPGHTVLVCELLEFISAGVLPNSGHLRLTFHTFQDAMGGSKCRRRPCSSKRGGEWQSLVSYSSGSLISWTCKAQCYVCQVHLFYYENVQDPLPGLSLELQARMKGTGYIGILVPTTFVSIAGCHGRNQKQSTQHKHLAPSLWCQRRFLQRRPRLQLSCMRRRYDLLGVTHRHV